jgi:GNAT superfamily N-acetyltransferase
MAWFMTEDLAEYLAAAGDFLESRPAENTLLLTVADALRARGNAAFGEAAPLFGWWRSDDGTVDSAFLHTPPHPIILAGVPDPAVVPLVESLARRGIQLPGLNASENVGTVFAKAWFQQTGAMSDVRERLRLYRLGDLTPPRPGPPGGARVAASVDQGLLTAWYEAFLRETGGKASDNIAGAVDDRIGYGGFTLWEVAGEPVSMAGISRALAGMVRLGPVYTPPGHRRRGYGGAVTAAVSRAAQGTRVREVLLFTDLANPTSNGLYQRLGYEPVGDRMVLSFARG